MLPLWTPERQLALYESIGYCKRGTRVDGQPWTRPDATDRFLLNWDKRYHVVICPRRASKSYAAAKKALPIILGRAPKADGTGPIPTRVWIVGPTYELAEKEFRYIWHDLMVVGPKLGWPKPIISRDSKKGGDLYILTAWGCEVVGKSADKPQSLLGEAVDLVILSEAATLPGEVWTRYLEPTLATTRGYALFPTTPDAGALWLYELWLRGVQDDPLVNSYSWDVTANPAYPLEELEEKRRFYGENHPAFKEQYLGKWTFYTGTVYGNDFDPERNIIDPPPPGTYTEPCDAHSLPLSWARIRAIDFGYRDAFVCLWFAITPKGSLWLYREYYQKEGRAMSYHAERIRRLSEGERILYTVADSSEPQAIADLRLLGVPAIPANRDRRAGRMLVGDYFRDGRLCFLRGACPETLAELSFYRWDKDKNKEGSKEATIGDDHAMDAMRYAIMSRPQPRKPRFDIPKGSIAYEISARRRERLARLWPLGA